MGREHKHGSSMNVGGLIPDGDRPVFEAALEKAFAGYRAISPFARVIRENNERLAGGRLEAQGAVSPPAALMPNRIALVNGSEFAFMGVDPASPGGDHAAVARGFVDDDDMVTIHVTVESAAPAQKRAPDPAPGWARAQAAVDSAKLKAAYRAGDKVFRRTLSDRAVGAAITAMKRVDF